MSCTSSRAATLMTLPLVDAHLHLLLRHLLSYSYILGATIHPTLPPTEAFLSSSFYIFVSHATFYDPTPVNMLKLHFKKFDNFIKQLPYSK